MLLHGNLIANARASSDYLLRGNVGAEGGDPVLSVLPFAHIYEHNNVLSYLLVGADIYVSGPDYLLEDMKSVRPKMIAFVPRMFERMLSGIAVSAAAAGGLRARLVPWALNVGRRVRGGDARAPSRRYARVTIRDRAAARTFEDKARRRPRPHRADRFGQRTAAPGYRAHLRRHRLADIRRLRIDRNLARLNGQSNRGESIR